MIIQLSDPFSRLRLALVLLPALLASGTLAYTVLGASIFDAFYMTLITISTVEMEQTTSGGARPSSAFSCGTAGWAASST